MHLDVGCPICLRKAETTLHALWICPLLKNLRSSCCLNGGKKVLDSASFLDFVISFSVKVNVQDFEILCIMWWHVWQRRNNVLHGQLLLPDSDIWEWAISFMHDFQEFNKIKLQGQHVTRPSERWQSPQEGVFKINIDAATRVRDGTSGIGVVIRDSHGHVRASLCQNLNANFQPQVAEALAILNGIDLAFENGFLPAVLESDALTVVNAISLKAVPHTEIFEKENTKA
ncbi:hypothetical protein Dsin_021160 [Dipteronia sinensis]|uniref:RNase H type-1 domain-containing protein n=1 Tax=Dipteronia sinensis TaxID=43782 RepID=A0AAE0ABC6_9ROSI|nr:hypothetical protein Dsin_021160 [Dipteronia sinensis]